jgi:hypothetical protein
VSCRRNACKTHSLRSSIINMLSAPAVHHSGRRAWAKMQWRFRLARLKKASSQIRMSVIASMPNETVDATFLLKCLPKSRLLEGFDCCSVRYHRYLMDLGLEEHFSYELWSRYFHRWNNWTGLGLPHPTFCHD